MNDAAGFRIHVQKKVKELGEQVVSRGTRITNALRNAELEVLSGARSGRIYRKSHTATATYAASAPGEAPARDKGHLRRKWKGEVKKSPSGNRIQVIPAIVSQQEYAKILEEGSKKIAPRPFRQRIIDKAMPEVRAILKEPYQ